MNDSKKTKPQLIAELTELRRSLSENKDIDSTGWNSRNKFIDQESEYKSILAHLNVIVLAGNHEKISYVGGNTEQILGYTIEDWMNDANGPRGFWYKHVDPRDRKEAARKCESSIDDGKDHVNEYRMIAADGSVVWFHDTVNVEVRDNWQISVRSVMVDITAHKELEEALKKTRQELEIRVNDRTRELTISNYKLTNEIAERKLIEEERKKTEEKLRDIETKLSQATSLAKLGHWDLDISSGEVFWTDEVYEIFEYKPGEIKPSYEIFLNFIHPEDRGAVKNAMEKSIEDSTAYEAEFRFFTSKGNLRYGHNKGEVSVDKDGNVVRLSGMIQDLTGRKRAEEQIKTSLAEKEVLLREIHHRVKNNMQVISSMLKLQAEKIKDKKHFHIFHESINRVHSMALIHTLLYHSGDLSRILFQEYVPKLCNNLLYLYKAQKRGIKIIYKIQDIHLTIETAIPCGLIINELVSNALKYAFPGDRKGVIFIKMRKVKGKNIRLSVSDNGVGMPKDFDFEKADSLGLEITNLLALQIGGKINHSKSIGTEFAISFKEDA